MSELTTKRSTKSESETASAYITDYPSNTSHWEQWQHDYKFGVILIYPPEPIFTIVNKLRQLHDPKSQSYSETHISLTVPLPGPVTEATWSELCGRMKHLGAFEVSYSAPTSYPGIPGVVLKAEPLEKLKNLVDTLERGEMFQGAKKRPYPFSPHITIAEFITLEQTEELAKALASHDFGPGTFRCDALSYTVPDDNMHFSERRSLRLS